MTRFSTCTISLDLSNCLLLLLAHVCYYMHVESEDEEIEELSVCVIFPPHSINLMKISGKKWNLLLEKLEY